jgi:hypothetical protein
MFGDRHAEKRRGPQDRRRGLTVDAGDRAVVEHHPGPGRINLEHVDQQIDQTIVESLLAVLAHDRQRIDRLKPQARVLSEPGDQLLISGRDPDDPCKGVRRAAPRGLRRALHRARVFGDDRRARVRRTADRHLQKKTRDRSAQRVAIDPLRIGSDPQDVKQRGDSDVDQMIALEPQVVREQQREQTGPHRVELDR